jgi:AraC family ethanolamine operon transcriptional activator
MVEARMDRRSGAAPPPVGVMRIATSSLEECSAWLETAGLTVRHNQIAQGPYAAEFDLFSLSRELQFSLSSYGAAITTQGASPRGRYSFSVPLSQPAGLHFNQHALSDSEIAVVRPGEEFYVNRPARFRALVVYAEAGLVERRCSALRGASARTLLGGGSTLRANRDALAACRGRFARIAEQALSGAFPSTNHAGDVTALTERLVDGLLEAIDSPQPLRGWSARHRLLDRARTMIEDDAAGVVRVAQLCLALGVPIRTLDDAFRVGMGMSPKRFILGVRLNKVRRQLSQPDETTTVTASATRQHFFHFGHFSSQYRWLFGETPSQTLHQRGRR